MPLALVIVVRLGIRVVRAVAATVRLARDRDTLRALPWPYVRALPRRNAWIGLATACLVLSVLALAAAAVVRQAAAVAFGIALLGVCLPWIRVAGRRLVPRR